MREEFRAMLIESKEDNLIDDEAHHLLENALDYHHTRVKDLVVTHSKTKAIAASLTVQEALDFAQVCQFNRLPVYKDNNKKWIGIFSIYDAIFMIPKEKWNEEKVLKHIRPIIPVFEESMSHQVIPRSRNTRSPMLVVFDKAHQQTGIITIGDVLNPLLGGLNI